VLDAGARQYPVMAERAAEPVGEDDRHPLGWQPSRRWGMPKSHWAAGR
jgi:hypothetical protein